MLSSRFAPLQGGAMETPQPNLPNCGNHTAIHGTPLPGVDSSFRLATFLILSGSTDSFPATHPDVWPGARPRHQAHSSQNPSAGN